MASNRAVLKLGVVLLISMVSVNSSGRDDTGSGGIALAVLASPDMAVAPRPAPPLTQVVLQYGQSREARRLLLESSLNAAPAYPQGGGSMSKVVSEPIRQRKHEARVALLRLDYSRSYWLLQDSVSVARFDTEYLGLMGTAALGATLFEEAQVIYERLVRLEPLEARFWAGLAVSQERGGQDPSYSYRRVTQLAEQSSVLHQMALEAMVTSAVPDAA